MPLDPRISAFVDRSDAVARSLGIARATLSTRLFQDGKRLGVIASGESDIGVRRLAQAERDLDELAADKGIETSDTVATDVGA